MDLMTFAGLALGLACMYWVMLHAGILNIIFNMDAFVLVYGGTFACMMITYPFSILRQVPHALRLVFFPKKSESASQMIQNMVHLAEVARRGGVDSLEQELPYLKDHFLQEGLQMLIDGLAPELVRENMEKSIAFSRVRHQQLSNVFKTMGTYAPVFGLMGTLIGVVQVLQHLTDANSLGRAMAIAITTTFYGIFGTNFIFLPIAGKLNSHSDAEMLLREVVIEGILAIQSREVPAIVSLKLQAYLSNRIREKQSKVPAAVADNLG